MTDIEQEKSAENAIPSWRKRQTIKRERELIDKYPPPSKIDDAAYQKWKDLKEKGIEEFSQSFLEDIEKNKIQLVSDSSVANKQIADLVETIKVKAKSLYPIAEELGLNLSVVPEIEIRTGDMVKLAGYYSSVPPILLFCENFSTLMSQDFQIAEAIICHEIAHFLKGDPTPDAAIRQWVNVCDKSAEPNTDLLGAIVMGNPRKYAGAMQKSLESIWPDELEKAESLEGDAFDTNTSDKQAAYMERFVHPQFDNYKPLASLLRQAFRWADILEENGITDKQGNIVDYKGALAMYSRAAGLISTAGKLDSFLAKQRFQGYSR